MHDSSPTLQWLPVLQIHKIRSHFQRFLVFYVAVPCAFFTILVYYPGYMSPDSVEQLRQARYGVTNNMYPPLMAYIWSITDKILPGPAGMLILHNIVFWFSLAMIAFTVIRRVFWQVIFVLAAGFWPPTYGSLGTIWKDVGMQIFLLAALAAIFYARYRQRVWPLFLSFLCLFVAGGYRHNGLAIAVPMIALGVIDFASLVPARLPRLHAILQKHNLKPVFYFATGTLCLGLLLNALRFVYTYHVQDVRQWVVAMTLDLVGISIEQNKNYLPRYFDPSGEITVEDLKGMYSPLSANSLGDPSCRKLLGMTHPSDKAIRFRVLTAEQARDLRDRWAETVLDNFGSYLHNRGITAAHLLVLDTYHPWYPFVRGIDPNPFGLQFQPSSLNSAVMRVIQASAFRTRLYSAWMYYVVVLVCCFISFLWDFAYARTVQFLALSTFLYLLSLFMFGASGDFRYNVWALTCAYICPILLCAGRTRKTSCQGSAA
jgi:hypothetical protein